MATTISLVNLSSGTLSVDLKFSEDRALRAKIALGASEAITNASLAELDANAQMQALLASGAAELSLTDGPTELLRATFPASGTDITIKASTAHKYQILDTTLVTSTAVGASTCTLRDALAGGGNALSSDMASAAQGRTADASTESDELAAGSLLILNKSAAGVAGEVHVFVQRLS